MESRMKSGAAGAEIGPHRQSSVVREIPSKPHDVRVEDLGDGSAHVSLRLPWPLVLQVLDLASKGGAGRTLEVTSGSHSVVGAV
jgi:hypothetical protein